MKDPRAIGAQIRMRLPKLTQLERKVVKAIQVKKDFSEQTSLKEVADENGVSEAMVVKITKKLDFSGFREFRSSLIIYNHLGVANLHSEIESSDSSEILIDKVFKTSIQAIEETATILDVNSFNRAAELIYMAKHIDLYGVGGSSSVARDLAHKLLKIGIKSSICDDSHVMLMSSAIITDEDVVIAFSHSGMTKAVIEPVKLAIKNGAKVIVLTNYDSSPLVDIAHIVLNSTSQGSHLLGENAASRIAQLNILDALFVAVAKQDLDKAERNINKTQQAVRNFREY